MFGKYGRVWTVSVLCGILLSLASNGVASAQTVRQVTDVKTAMTGPGALDDAGTTVFAGVSADLLGTNPAHGFRLLAFDAATGSPSAVLADAPLLPLVGVSDDGQLLAFVSGANLSGANHDESAELFVVRRDGTGLLQLSSDPAVNAGSVSALALAGDGSVVAFVANTDPLGSNPNHASQLFIVETTGTGLVQLTSFTDGRFGMLSISDDGARIAFGFDGDPLGTNADRGTELFTVLEDGSDLRQMTSSPDGYDASLPALSGDGQTLAFQSDADPLGGNGEHQDEIFAIDWDGANLRQLTSTSAVLGITGDPASQFPSITDDGAFVYYHTNQSSLFSNFDGNYEIARIRRDGSGRQLLTSTALSAGSFLPVVSGDGSRVAYFGFGSEIRLRVMRGTGGDERSLAEFDLVFQEDASLSPDGTRAVFVRKTSLLGGGELYRVDVDGGSPVLVTDAGGGTPARPAIAADNDTIVYEIDDEIHAIEAGGSNPRRLSDGDSGTKERRADLSDDGSWVVFEREAGDTTTVWRVESDGSGLTELVAGPTGTRSQRPRIGGEGSWVVFESNADLLGTNADGSFEIFRVAVDGSGLTQVSEGVGHDARSPDVSDSGALVTFSSTADPLGSNADGNREIFTLRVADGSVFQLTDTALGSNGAPRISGDGAWVWFVSNAPITESDPDAPADYYRVPATGGVVHRVGGLRRGASAAIGPVSLGGSSGLALDSSGERAVFSGLGDYTAENADLLSELWLVDREATPRFEIGAASPTLLRWSVLSGPLRYDVLRGNVAELGPAGGGVTDLGPVSCLEDDSPDATTTGFEDTLQPGAGEAWFFLYRGSEGLLAGPGSWGTPPREPASGGCTP